MSRLLRLFCAIFLLSASVAKAEDPLSFKAVSDTDLTVAFHTKTDWRLVITQEPVPKDDYVFGDVHFCFIHGGAPSCLDNRIPGCVSLDGKPKCNPSDETAEGNYTQVGEVLIFRPKHGSSRRLLVVTAGSLWVGSSFLRGPNIWAYRPSTDSFQQIFAGWGAVNTNGEARFITEGPLAGDVIIGEATEHRHFGYRITVYQFQKTGHYKKALSYIGNTRYGDGNPLAVIDSQMPETLRRLRLWRVGDPLPAPAQRPVPCLALELRQGVEWCK